MSDPCASVIIPVWNGRSYLPACLEALNAQTYSPLQVVVVDNASTDGSAALVSEKYPWVRLVRNDVNLGFAGACNIGIGVAQGEVLALLNQDTSVHPGWLEALVDALQDQRTGIAGSKILYPDGVTLQHAGAWIEWPLGLAHHYGRGDADRGQWDEARQVEYVTGAAVAFRREILSRVGLLDRDFWPGYFEDADFCLRIREAGYQVWYVGQAVVNHAETTSVTDPATVACAYERGRMRFLLKHLAPHRFLSEFVPAEKAYQLRGQGYGSPLRKAYLESIPVAVFLLARRWHADVATIDRVLLALQELYRARTWRACRTSPLSFVPPLDEFEFHSSVPVIGPVIVWWRRLWYNVAARWAMRYLVQQQEAINQQQGACIRSLISLSQEMSRLIMQLEGEQDE